MGVAPTHKLLIAVSTRYRLINQENPRPAIQPTGKMMTELTVIIGGEPVPASLVFFYLLLWGVPWFTGVWIITGKLANWIVNPIRDWHIKRLRKRLGDGT